jgi:hypothetical protein
MKPLTLPSGSQVHLTVTGEGLKRLMLAAHKHDLEAAATLERQRLEDAAWDALKPRATAETWLEQKTVRP